MSMRSISIEWIPLDIRVTVELNENINSNLVDLLWNNLPYRSLQNHALVSGCHLYHLAPIHELIYENAKYKVDRTKSPDGTVFLSQLQHLAIKYGELSEYIPAAPVGQVVQNDIPLLVKAGQECWRAAYSTKRVIEVRVYRNEERPPVFALRWHSGPDEPALEPLVSSLREATEKIWTDPPRELIDIHSGNIASGAGSYDQYLSTMVFVNGETRPLGYCTLNGLVRLCQDENISLEVLKAVAPCLIRVPAEFLGYCGIDSLWEYTRRAIDSLEMMRSKRDFFSVFSALALYANCLNAWNLHYFPWGLGETFRHGKANHSLV